MNVTTTKRVKKPPGGECSNIFGQPDADTKLTSKNNPSLESTVFSNDPADAEVKRVHPKHKTIKVQQQQQPFPSSNVYRNRMIESSVFSHFQYPENAKFEPGVSRRPNSAYKSANNNIKSSVFDGYGTVSGGEKTKKHVESRSTKSSVFNLTSNMPETPVCRHVSKTYQCTMNGDEQEIKFLSTKRSHKNYNHSVMTGGSCDIVADKAVIMSSDNRLASLKFIRKPDSNDSGNIFVADSASSAEATAIPNSPTKPNRKSNKFDSHIFDPDDLQHPVPLFTSGFRPTPLLIDKRSLHSFQSCCSANDEEDHEESANENCS